MLQDEIILDVFVGDEFAFNYAGKKTSDFIVAALKNPVVIDISGLKLLPMKGDVWLGGHNFEFTSGKATENNVFSHGIFALIVDNVVEHVKMFPRTTETNKLVIAAMGSNPTFVRVEHGRKFNSLAEV